jgi:eukaryotic-like serine/threonine-protein kinase
MILKEGEILKDRYEIIKALGSGGFGIVYLATDTLGLPPKKVAIKMLNLPDDPVRETETPIPEDKSTRPYEVSGQVPISTRDKILLQFKGEARILYNIRHNNLPEGTDYDGEKGYLVMEFIEGENLEGKRAGHQEIGTFIPMIYIMKWFAGIFDALMLCHQRNITHRDIKPSNIVVRNDENAFLVDFGIAILASKDTSTMIRGHSVNYSPPEQFVSKLPIDERSDIYSLGATLYAVLTNQIPASALARKTGEQLVSIREINPDVSPRLQEAVHKAMELEPDDRYQNIQEMAQVVLSDVVTSSERNFEQTLQSAIKNAHPESVLYLIDDNYSVVPNVEGLGLEIYQSLELRGFGMDTTTIHCSGGSSVIGIGSGGSFKASGIHFKLREMEFDEEMDDEMECGDVIFADSCEIEFDRCKFTGGWHNQEKAIPYGHGLALENVEGIIKNCIIADNQSSGVYIGGGCSITLQGNRVENNGLAGISITENAEGLIEKNECSKNELFGIFVRDQATAQLEGNICCNNDDAGIYFDDQSTGSAIGNRCANNRGHGSDSGIYVFSESSPDIKYNFCYDQTIGIFYCGSPGGAISNNFCIHNEIGIILVSSMTVDSNYVCQNSKEGIEICPSVGNDKGTEINIKNNECCQNGIGIVVTEDSRVTIESNTISENEKTGIEFSMNSSGIVQGNYLNNNKGGHISIPEGCDVVQSNNQITSDEVLPQE